MKRKNFLLTVTLTIVAIVILAYAAAKVTTKPAYPFNVVFENGKTLKVDAGSYQFRTSVVKITINEHQTTVESKKDSATVVERVITVPEQVVYLPYSQIKMIGQGGVNDSQ